MTLPTELSDARLLRLWDLLPGARIVGGAVRDVLAGRLVADIDLATPRTPDQVTRALSDAGVRVIPTGLSHGTVTALVDDRTFEITTLRRDVATDGRRAVVLFTDDWRDDAARRDFTFNAMSMDRDGRIFDYFGGRADLAEGVVRFVGDAPTRIAEDYLRALRFFRFFARYGCQDPDPPLRDALRNAAGALGRLSKERVWSEIRLLLSVSQEPSPQPSPECGGGLGRGPSRALDLMAELGLLFPVVGVASISPTFRRLLATGAPADPLLRLAALTDESSARLTERFRLPGQVQSDLDALRSPLPPGPDAPGRIRRWLHAWPRLDLFVFWTWLHDRPDLRHVMAEASIAPPVFPLHGRDLLPLGWEPGRDLGRALADVREQWLDGGCVATRDELLAQLVPPPTA